jgi:peroxiredoxin
MATEVVTVAVPRIPRINDPAPDFEATSTHGIIRLSDYTSKGKWVLLFSHPADFHSRLHHGICGIRPPLSRV